MKLIVHFDAHQLQPATPLPGQREREQLTLFQLHLAAQREPAHTFHMLNARWLRWRRASISLNKATREPSPVRRVNGPPGHIADIGSIWYARARRSTRLVSPRGTLRTHPIRILYTQQRACYRERGRGEREGASARTTLCVSSPQLGTLPTFKIHMYLQDTRISCAKAQPVAH